MDAAELEPSGGLYLNVVPLLNQRFAQLCDALAGWDTRGKYLLDFEVVLGAALPQALSEYDSYQKVKGKYGAVVSDRMLGESAYRAWVVAYEEVMRDAHLIRSGDPAPIGA